MAYEIQTSVPIPAGPWGAKKNPGSLAGTIRRLAIGETFFAPAKTPQVASATIRTQRVRGNMDLSRQFATRTVTENGIKGVRVWRIA